MFTYYLDDDNETIYRIEMSLKQEEKEYYLSLLNNYLTELIFVEENKLKKLVQEEEIQKENQESVGIENGQLFLEKAMVTNVEKIEDYLPSIITVKSKKYFFLRPYTICLLIKLLSNDLDKMEHHPFVDKVISLLNHSCCIDFKLIFETFFEENGNLLNEKFYDYHAFVNLLKNLKQEITEKYSRSGLINFWQGDDAERCVAEGIASDAPANKDYLRKLNLEIEIKAAK